MSATRYSLPRSTVVSWGDWFAARVCAEDRGHPTPCWIWQCSSSAAGYARTFVRFAGSRYTKGHRLAYAALVGPILRGLEIDHLCRQTMCVNPGHLEPVTPHENITRAIPYSRARNALMRKAMCGRGHLQSPENTFVDSRGWRNCRPCKSEIKRAYRRRLRGL
jgi:hypothetical protein